MLSLSNIRATSVVPPQKHTMIFEISQASVIINGNAEIRHGKFLFLHQFTLFHAKALNYLDLVNNSCCISPKFKPNMKNAF